MLLSLFVDPLRVEFYDKPIAKADELPVHNRKGVGNQKEKGGGVL